MRSREVVALKIAVLLTERNLDKKEALKKTFSQDEMCFYESVDKLQQDIPTTPADQYIIDFNIGNSDHIDLIEFLKDKISSECYVFLADLDLESDIDGKTQLASELDDQKVRDFVNKVVEVGSETPNDYITLPLLRLDTVDIVFSHSDDHIFYFYSKSPLTDKDLPLELIMSLEGKDVRIPCQGTISESESFDEDLDDKHYYQVVLDEESQKNFIPYFEKNQAMVDETNSWIQIHISEEEGSEE